MFKPKDHKARVLHRMKIAQGHLRKVLEMIEQDSYCIDVLTQSQAVQSSLKEIDNLILENHLKTCAADAIRSGKEESAIKEVMEVFKKKS